MCWKFEWNYEVGRQAEKRPPLPASRRTRAEYTAQVPEPDGRGRREGGEGRHALRLPSMFFLTPS